MLPACHSPGDVGVRSGSRHLCSEHGNPTSTSITSDPIARGSRHRSNNNRTGTTTASAAVEEDWDDDGSMVADTVLECLDLAATVALVRAARSTLTGGTAHAIGAVLRHPSRDHAAAAVVGTLSTTTVAPLTPSALAGGSSPLPSTGTAAMLRSSPIAIPTARTSLRPGVDVLSPEAVWNRKVSSAPNALRRRESYDAHTLRVAELITRGTPGSPPSDCGDLLFSLTYHISVRLAEPVKLSALPSDHVFLVQLQCKKKSPLDTEHVLEFTTPEIEWISDPDDPDQCIWLSSTCYIARQSAADPFVVVELELHDDGYTTERVATAIGLPCVPASDLLFGAPKGRTDHAL